MTDYANTDMEVKRLLAGPSSASAMDKELERLTKQFAEDSRYTRIYLIALAVFLLFAIVLLVCWCQSPATAY